MKISIKFASNSINDMLRGKILPNSSLTHHFLFSKSLSIFFSFRLLDRERFKLKFVVRENKFSYWTLECQNQV